MSVDAEITRINEGIASVHLALYKFNNQLDGILKRLNTVLNTFDTKVDNAVGKVNGVGEQVLNIFQHFPSNAVYYIIMLMLIMILNLLCLYLVYYIYKWITEREFRFDKEVRCYKKKVYSVIDDERPVKSLVNVETPPAIYHEHLWRTGGSHMRHERNDRKRTP